MIHRTTILIKLAFICVYFLPLMALAQNNLLDELEADSAGRLDETFATFKGTRVVNGHSVETTPGGALEFIFSHRFGAINAGWYEMFGLDQAYVRIGLDYGITDRLSASLGRNSINKTLDWYAKYKISRQHSGASSFPVTITGLGGVAYQLYPKRRTDVTPPMERTDRLAYTGQLLIARKFTPALSLQLMPTIIHKNRVESVIEDNTQIALGAAGRIKVTPSMAITGEYYHNFSRKDNSPLYNSVGFGIDIETGGHVFQLVFTNAIGLTERAFITETADNFFDGDIHFGFNVTRTFQFRKD